jgi:hypothetical protein
MRQICFTRPATTTTPTTHPRPHNPQKQNQQPEQIKQQGTHQHESYLGDRTKHELVAFADSLVLSAGAPHAQKGQLVAAPRVHGCNLAGFVLVNKVPGTLHFVARAEGHSFGGWMNMTHKVHSLRFGARLTARQTRELRRLRAAVGGGGGGGLGGGGKGAGVDWQDRVAGQLFFSDILQHTHEHALQVGQGLGGGLPALVLLFVFWRALLFVLLCACVLFCSRRSFKDHTPT